MAWPWVFLNLLVDSQTEACVSRNSRWLTSHSSPSSLHTPQWCSPNSLYFCLNSSWSLWGLCQPCCVDPYCWLLAHLADDTPVCLTLLGSPRCALSDLIESPRNSVCSASFPPSDMRFFSLWGQFHAATSGSVFLRPETPTLVPRIGNCLNLT